MAERPAPVAAQAQGPAVPYRGVISLRPLRAECIECGAVLRPKRGGGLEGTQQALWGHKCTGVTTRRGRPGWAVVCRPCNKVISKKTRSDAERVRELHDKLHNGESGRRGHAAGEG